jgi:hypothetical protein
MRTVQPRGAAKMPNLRLHLAGLHEWLRNRPQPEPCQTGCAPSAPTPRKNTLWSTLEEAVSSAAGARGPGGAEAAGSVGRSARPVARAGARGRVGRRAVAPGRSGAVATAAPSHQNLAAAAA